MAVVGVAVRDRRRRNLEQQRAGSALARLAGEADIVVLASAVQAVLGYVAPTCFAQIAERAGTTPEAVHELVEQSDELRNTPIGRHRVTICTGRTCARRGGAELVRAARRALGVGVFETTPDAAVRLEPFRCFGHCAMAPNILIDGSIRGAMTRERLLLLLKVMS